MDGRDDGAGGGDVVALVGEIAAFFADLEALGDGRLFSTPVSESDEHGCRRGVGKEDV